MESQPINQLLSNKIAPRFPRFSQMSLHRSRTMAFGRLQNGYCAVLAKKKKEKQRDSVKL